MNKAQIFQPTKTAMQSGKGKTKDWKLKYYPKSKVKVDKLMGWQGNNDMNQQVILSFDSKEAAIFYAENHNIEYDLVEPKKAKIIIKSYADNFVD